MTSGSSLFILLGLFLLGGVYSFWKQKHSKSVIALLAIGSLMAIVAGLLQL
jgi:drug/metabolite transporter superfamily protein YnfA